MILNHINDIASICAGHGVTTAIISPGSRSAPLTLAFTRHPDIDTRVIPDERSAAFIAMGIAQQQKCPVVLICTSGSAAYNYAPAIAEAYFQEIPLLVLTADRPPEWTNQYDGQTIQQSNIYGKHVKSSFDFPVNPDHPDVLWHCNRIVNESLLITQRAPAGPVHINIPFREPFYPGKDERFHFNEVRIIQESESVPVLKEEEWNKLHSDWESASKKAIVISHLDPSETLSGALTKFSNETNTPVIADIISNQHQVENSVQCQDVFLNLKSHKRFEGIAPELLITIGKSLISKNLKTFLRKNSPKMHWHIQEGDRLNDALQHVTRIIQTSPKAFFEHFTPKSSPPHFKDSWVSINNSVRNQIDEFLNSCSFGEFRAVQMCMQSLPSNSQLHLANSMAVRYANFLTLPDNDVRVYSNRGTSGIDGSNSTAVGAALSQDRIVTLITGDMAFFYDRNAFWHNYNLKNLRVVILNNHAGGIFRLIDGPANQPELQEYFETEQKLSAEHTATDFGFEYEKVSDQMRLNKALDSFYAESQNAKILEIESSSSVNAEIFASFKQKFIEQI